MERTFTGRQGKEEHPKARELSKQIASLSLLGIQQSAVQDK